MSEPLDITTARALCDGATPGPWRVNVAEFGHDLVHDMWGRVVCSVRNWRTDGVDAKANRDFIAAARTLLPAALDALESMGSELAQQEVMAMEGQARLLCAETRLRAALDEIERGRRERADEQVETWKRMEAEKVAAYEAGKADEAERGRERERGLVEALTPFANFAEKFDAQPLKSLDDRFYSIHMGTEFEAELRISDCRNARAALAQAKEQGNG